GAVWEEAVLEHGAGHVGGNDGAAFAAFAQRGAVLVLFRDVLDDAENPSRRTVRARLDLPRETEPAQNAVRANDPHHIRRSRHAPGPNIAGKAAHLRAVPRVHDLVEALPFRRE